MECKYIIIYSRYLTHLIGLYNELFKHHLKKSIYFQTSQYLSTCTSTMLGHDIKILLKLKYLQTSNVKFVF